MGKLFSKVLLLVCMLQTVNAQPLKINGASYNQVGKATFSVLWFDIYQSELFTPSGKYDKDEKNFVFRISYLKPISSEELIERTVEQWQHIQYPKEWYEKFLPRLKTLWPDIKAGDQLMMVTSENQSEFIYNGQSIGAIEDKQFGHLFIDIWLSPKTSQPKLRQRLLGDYAS